MAKARIEVRRYSGDALVHAHDHHQLVLPLQGRLEMEIAGRGDSVRAARGALVAAGEHHSFQGAVGTTCLVVDISDPGLQGGPSLHQALWETVVARPFIEIDPALERLLTFLALEVEGSGLEGARAASACELLLGSLERRLEIVPSRASAVIARALAFIDRHYNEPIEIAHVARAAGLSPSRLHALFREELGASPGQTIATRRLTEAARLLERGERSLADIAFAVGYGDQSAFTRAFRRKLGTTPAEFRRSLRGQESRHKL
ncbi:MAG: AraC family transcriptional regulator [Pseudomonadota bacterium]